MRKPEADYHVFLNFILGTKYPTWKQTAQVFIRQNESWGDDFGGKIRFLKSWFFTNLKTELLVYHFFFLNYASSYFEVQRNYCLILHLVYLNGDRTERNKHLTICLTISFVKLHFRKL